MRTILLAVLAMGLAGLVSGCATPGYTGGPPNLRPLPEKMSGEESNRIVRNWDLEGKMITDDVIRFWMMDPLTLLTQWSIR